MNVRRAKLLVAAAAGGILLQAGGCATIIADILAQQIFSLIVSGIIDAVLGGAQGMA